MVPFVEVQFYLHCLKKNLYLKKETYFFANYKHVERGVLKRLYKILFIFLLKAEFQSNVWKHVYLTI